ncbi:hypothetical protein GOP47_0022384 [Adiantum capillus-veneris]|uniref:SAM domain-containing protein n=1 Tax=Adiantum capillus-veneris TaxID=13818 RepID=A0A9D4U680_ADICA|nr:hypothetical protein GOP47_0022384 [Adiantum capillus-veneris]
MENEPLKSIFLWNAEKVAAFVNEFLGMDRYTKSICKNNIDGRSLLYTSVASWGALGIEVSGHRLALHSWAQRKLAKAETLSSTPAKQVSQEVPPHMQHDHLSLTYIGRDEANFSNNELNFQAKSKSHFVVQIPKSAKEKGLLRINHAWEHRTYNRNMERIRMWTEQGLGLFPIDKFMQAYFKKDKEMRQQVEKFIHRKRRTLSPFRARNEAKDSDYMTERQIFLKINQHRHYMRLKAGPLFEGLGKIHQIPVEDILHLESVDEDRNHEEVGTEMVDLEEMICLKV